MIILVGFLFSYGKDIRPYGFLGLWSPQGLTAGAGYGFWGDEQCPGYLFQWSGIAAYQYHPQWTGTGQVNIYGGRLEGNRSISLTQYWVGLQHNIPFEKTFLGIRLEVGLDNSALTSAVPEENPEDICPEFIHKNGSGVAASYLFSHPLTYSLWLTSQGKYGVSYKGRWINEMSLGLAFDLQRLFRHAEKKTMGFFVFNELIALYDDRAYRLSYRLGLSLLM